MPTYATRVTRVVEHGHETRSLFVERPAGFAWEPGQFVSCQLPIGAAVVSKPYTIASTPSPELELLFNRVPGGPASSYLYDRSVGDALHFTGPWGAFTFVPPPSAPTVFIAIGLGIAAIRPMLHAAVHTPVPLDLLYAANFPLYHDELAALPGIDAVVVPEAALQTTIETRWIARDVDRSHHFYVCGVGNDVLAIRDRLRGSGYPRRAVRYEKW